MYLISCIWILGATTGVIFILLLFFLRRQQEQQNEKIRNFLENLDQQQRAYLEKFISDRRLFEAEQMEKIKEWLLWKDYIGNEQ